MTILCFICLVIEILYLYTPRESFIKPTTMLVVMYCGLAFYWLWFVYVAYTNVDLKYFEMKCMLLQVTLNPYYATDLSQ